jgi:hypothetical protein
MGNGSDVRGKRAGAARSGVWKFWAAHRPDWRSAAASCRVIGYVCCPGELAGAWTNLDLLANADVGDRA